MGVFEIDAFSKGTFEICNSVTEATKKGAFSLVGVEILYQLSKKTTKKIIFRLYLQEVEHYLNIYQMELFLH